MAKSRVRVGKHLIMKCMTAKPKQCYCKAISYYNVCPCSDGYSPSELFLGRRPRTLIPELYGPTNLTDAITARHEAASKLKERASSNIEQPPLQVGDIVWMQEEVGCDKGQYKHLCTVIEVRSHGRSYYVKNIESRRIYLRNRKKLMLDKSECDTVVQTLLQETLMLDDINP